jgi:hypothetical protein
MARLVGATRRLVGKVVDARVPRADMGRRVSPGYYKEASHSRAGLWTGRRIPTNIRRVRRLCRFVPMLVAIVVACDEGDVHFTTNFASDFTPARHTVSVLGVYKDGRMSTSGWETLGPHVMPALGTAHCDVGYNALVSSNGALADAIDEYARADGPTDDLLAQISPRGEGTFVGFTPEGRTK